MIGLAFSSEPEASDLFKKISLRHKYAKKANKSSSSSASKINSSPASSSKRKSKGGIDKSMIGAPTGFDHVAHMGFDSEKGFSSTNVDPSWERLLGQLESQGVSRVSLVVQIPLSKRQAHRDNRQSQILKNETFIRNFVEGSGGPPPAPSSRDPPVKRVPPPAPPSRMSISAPPPSKRAPPTPPAPRRAEPSPPAMQAPIRAVPVGMPPPPPPPPPPIGRSPGKQYFSRSHFCLKLI
jgi:hypothetical protein